ncbi:MAG: hypothetical protein P8J78_03215 [Maricaulis sp.]|nr:hypothetical protein [Maricaulis sp.]
MSDRLVALVALACALTAQADAQSDRALTCELVRDIGQIETAGMVVDRGDLAFYSPHFDARDNDFVLANFSDLFDYVTDAVRTGPVDREWEDAVTALPVSMMQDLWVGWDRGGEVNCPELSSVVWLDGLEAGRRFQAVANEQAVRRNLPPNNPDHLPPAGLHPHFGLVGPDVAQNFYIEISIPAFNTTRQRALLLRHGRPEIYRRINDGWVLEAAPVYFPIF